MSQKLSSESSSILKGAFGLEIALNTIAGVVLIASPTTALTQMARSTAFITPTATLLAQLAGSMIMSFSAPLVLGLRAGPRDRKMAYWFLAAGEVVLVPVLVGKYLNGTDAGVKDNKELLVMASNLLVFFVWRVWCLGWRPQWFGVEQTGKLSQD